MSKDAISDQLRAALVGGESSLHAVAAEAGVPRSSLSRFVRGERSLSLETVDAVAKALGFRLVQTRRRRVRKS